MSEQTMEDLQDLEEMQEEHAPLERRSARRKRQKWPYLELNVDVVLLLVIFPLLIFGVLMVYSASWDFSLLNYANAT